MTMIIIIIIITKIEQKYVFGNHIPLLIYELYYLLGGGEGHPVYHTRKNIEV